MNTLRTAVSLAMGALLPLGYAFAQAGNQTNSSEESIENIIVHGTTGDREAARAELALVPGGASLIDLDDLRNRNVGSLADALRYVPGIWSVSDTGNDGIYFSSRGSNLDATDYDMNGIKLLQDGLPVTTADGNNHNRIIDPLAAEYAVAARGANALKYGASTLGGAVNFVSPTAYTAPRQEVSLTTGSHGQMLARASAGRTFSDALDALVTLEAKNWDGYRAHNEQDRIGLYANTGWRISDRLSTRFYVTYLENDQRLPGTLTHEQLETDPNQASSGAIGGDYQLNVDTLRLANKTALQLDAARSLEFGFSIEQQSLYHPIVDRVMVDFDGPGPAPPVEVFSLLIDTDHEDIGTMVRYNHRLDRHDLLFGLNYGVNAVDGEHYRNLNGKPNGLKTFIENNASTLEAFAMDRWKVADRTTLVLALQSVSAERDVLNIDAVTGSRRNPNSRHSSVNPRLGFLRSIGEGTTLFANVSKLYEPPTNFQLEDNVAGGDATLDAMHGSVFEVGFRGGRELSGGGDWAWDVTVYQADIRDEILSVEDPSAPGTSLVTNIDKTRHSGIEGVLSASFALGGTSGRSLDTLLSMTINDFTFVNDSDYGSNDLPAAPDYFARAEILYRGRGGMYVGPVLDFVGDRFADFANSYRIPSYTQIGLRAGWSSERWQAFAEVRNIEDEVYIVSHSVRDRAGPGDAILNSGEPLSGYVGFRVRFE